MKFVLHGLFDYKSALVQIMSRWTESLSEPMMVDLTDTYMHLSDFVTLLVTDWQLKLTCCTRLYVFNVRQCSNILLLRFNSSLPGLNGRHVDRRHFQMHFRE